MDNFPGFSRTSPSLPQDYQPVVKETVGNDFDSRMMLRCVELARTALGRILLNPLVGAVVV